MVMVSYPQHFGRGVRRQQPGSRMTTGIDPRARKYTFVSRALGISKSFYAYVPPELTSGARAPTLYLLRGHEREYVNRREDPSRTGSAIDVYEAQRAAGQIGPLVLVFPGLSSDDNRYPGMIVNMARPELAAESGGIGSGRFYDYFFDDLMTYVDRHLPTLGGRQQALFGFSLGGASALAAAAMHPARFAAAVAYDGTFLYAANRGRNVRKTDRVPRNPMFAPAWGEPRNDALMAAHNAPNLVLRGDAKQLAQVTWAVGYGPKVFEPWRANYNRGEHMVECLKQRGIPNAIGDGEQRLGDHTWLVADAFLAATLPLIDAALRRVG